MMYDKKCILRQRLISGILLFLGILIPVIVALVDLLVFAVLLYIFVFIDIFLLVYFINALQIRYKVYDYNGNEIIVFAGFANHYIKINGEIFDEYRSLFTYTPVILSCTLEDADIKATISLTNRISLKINNQLYR